MVVGLKCERRSTTTASRSRDQGQAPGKQVPDHLLLVETPLDAHRQQAGEQRGQSHLDRCVGQGRREAGPKPDPQIVHDLVSISLLGDATGIGTSIGDGL